MLSAGDGIALASVAGIIITAILRLVKKNGTNGYVTKDTCKARTDGFSKELKLIEENLVSISSRLDDINRFLRRK